MRRSASNLVAAAMAGAVLASGAGHALAQERPLPRINVTGEASVNVAPDLAILHLGVLREAETARDALTANNAAMQEVIEAMKGEGIESRDLQTSGFSIQPKYEYYQPKQGEVQKPPRIVGYMVANDLTVRVRDLARLGTILDRSVTLGVNSGGGVHFTNDDPRKAIAQARAEAMKDALERARTLTEAAGIGLGPIIEINESFNRPGPLPMLKGRMMEAAADAVPIEAGENTYSITVSVSIELKQ